MTLVLTITCLLLALAVAGMGVLAVKTLRRSLELYKIIDTQRKIITAQQQDIRRKDARITALRAGLDKSARLRAEQDALAQAPTPSWRSH